MTGYSFEILFAICQLDKSKFEQAFEMEFKRAEKNLAKLTHVQARGNNFRKDKLLFGAKNEDYNQILPVIRKLLNKKRIDILERVSPFPSFEISTDLFLYPDLLMEVAFKTGLNPFNPYRSIERIIVFNSDSCTSCLKKLPEYFREEIIRFYKTRKCTESFVNAILCFAQVSYQFASHFLFEILFFSDAYLKKTTDQFKYFCKNNFLIKGKLTRTPNLDLLEICARPDFLINNKMYEIKACKKFASVEYLQALTYLIFAQHPENRKIYGKVKSIILYYVLTNQQIEIKSKDLILDEHVWEELALSIRSYKAKKSAGR